MKISFDLRDQTAAKAQAIADHEKISLSVVIERSIELVDIIPQEIRELIVELEANDDAAGLQALREELISLVRKSRVGMALR